MHSPVVYQGYAIRNVEGGYIWTDLRGFTHYYEGATETPFGSVQDAKESIDAVTRAMAPELP